jgi:hypothetical protein
VADVQEPTGPSSERPLPVSDVAAMLSKLDESLQPGCGWPECPGVAEWFFRCRVCTEILDFAVFCAPHVSVYARAKRAEVTTRGVEHPMRHDCGERGWFPVLFYAEQIPGVHSCGS